MIDEEVFEKVGKKSFMFLAEQTVAMNMVKAEKENELVSDFSYILSQERFGNTNGNGGSGDGDGNSRTTNRSRWIHSATKVSFSLAEVKVKSRGKSTEAEFSAQVTIQPHFLMI